MPDLEGLLARDRSVAAALGDIARQGKRILVVTHIDADGLTSGAVVFKALQRRGANVAVRAVADLNPSRISGLVEGNHDFYLFTDLGSTLLKELTASLDSKYLVVDHHQMPPEDVANPHALNAWQFGFDGGHEACSSTMAYFLAKALDEKNTDSAPLAVIGAVADRQDTGPGRSLTGLNRTALEDAQSAGLVSVAKDLLFYGRETRPIHESIALTSSPHLKGLSGSRDATLAALVKGGIRVNEGGRLRSLAELSEQEKKQVMEILASILAPESGVDAVLSQLVGEVYTLESEDPFTPLRDSREFATMLNACGRMEKSGVGISICLGDRNDSMKEGKGVLQLYRQSINKAVQGVLGEESRVQLADGAAVIRGDELVDERILGPTTSILASTERLKDRVLIARTRSGENELKFSTRVGDKFVREVNLGVIMREAAEMTGGVGGGHAMAAGAKIPLDKGEEFLKLVLERVAG
jgi:single-stranded-DNA-specific exonuclease